MDDGAVNKYITYDGKLSGIPVVISAYDIAELFGGQLGVSTKAPESDEDKTAWLNGIQEKPAALPMRCVTATQPSETCCTRRSRQLVRWN